LNNRNMKQLDASFRPRDITVFPAVYKLRRLANIPSSNVAAKIAHRHESWVNLLDNSKRRALSPSTSIQAVIGMKICPNHIRCFWMEPMTVAPSNQIRAESQRVPKYIPTNLTFTIPGRSIGCGTRTAGNTATPTSDLVLLIDQLRAQAAKYS